MHDAIPNSSLVIIPRVGHLSNLEAPALWGRAFERWTQD
jgi:pimeloyl-ACP methyl ester carboxylesterase